MFLDKTSLENLAKYKYHAGIETPLDKYVMQPFWRWCLQFIPIWMAPNLVTLLGLACTVSSSIVLFTYSPTFSSSPPPWAFYFGIMAVFTYQTLDALDGKQARRTESSSPLGQLFDHGCDAISGVVTAIVVMITLKTGWHESDPSSIWPMYCMIVPFIPFYLSQWEEYHTGVLNISNGYVGVSEIQDIQIVLMLLAAIFGVDIYDTIIYQSWTLRDAVLTVISTAGVMYFLGSAKKVYFPDQAMADDERGSKLFGAMHATKQIIPLVLLTITSFSHVYLNDSSQLYHKHYPLLVFSIGLSLSLVSTHVVLLHMAKMAQPWFLSGLLMTAVPSIVIAVANYRYADEQMGLQLLYAWFFGLLVYYAIFIKTSVTDICNHLGINCFKIKLKKKA